MGRSEPAFEVLALDTAEALSLSDDGLAWIPLRRRMGVEAFGVNAFRGARRGDVVIEDHVESPGQEELYVVVRGAARLQIDEDTVEVDAGSVVFVSDPEARRHAIALADGTIVLAVGGWPGRAYHVLPWEPIYMARPAMRRGEWAEAADVLLAEGGEHLETAILQYRLACCHARLGEENRAVTELERAVAIDPSYRERAESEPAFAALRERGEWPA